MEQIYSYEIQNTDVHYKVFKCKTLKTIYSSDSKRRPKRYILDHGIGILRICILTNDFFYKLYPYLQR